MAYQRPHCGLDCKRAAVLAPSPLPTFTLPLHAAPPLQSSPSVAATKPLAPLTGTRAAAPLQAWRARPARVRALAADCHALDARQGTVVVARTHRALGTAAADRWATSLAVANDGQPVLMGAGNRSDGCSGGVGSSDGGGSLGWGGTCLLRNPTAEGKAYHHRHSAPEGGACLRRHPTPILRVEPPSTHPRAQCIQQWGDGCAIRRVEQRTQGGREGLGRNAAPAETAAAAAAAVADRDGCGRAERAHSPLDPLPRSLMLQ